MELNSKNYFSPEAMQKYWSVSQFKSFIKCEAAAMAELDGTYKPEQTTALLVGSYVDAYFSGELEEFKAEHPEIFKKDGTLKSDYVQADAIIERALSDKVFMQFLTGIPQKIMTADLFGYPWKIKIDALHPNRAIVDLKVMKDFEPIYEEGNGKVSFIDHYGYDIQGAVYQAVYKAVTGEQLPFYIAALTKERETDLDVFQISQPVLDTALSVVKNKIDHFADVKAGLEKPTRCEKCAYCKRTKRLRTPKIYGEEI